MKNPMFVSQWGVCVCGGGDWEVWNIYHYQRRAFDILTQRRFNISSHAGSSVLTIVRSQWWVWGWGSEGGRGGQACTLAGLKGEWRKMEKKKKEKKN